MLALSSDRYFEMYFAIWWAGRGRQPDQHPKPDLKMYLTKPLHKGRHERSDRTVLVCGSRRSSFALVDRVARLAAALRSLGLQPGDRVGMLALNSDRYVEYLYGVWWAGGVINLVNIPAAASTKMASSTSSIG
jgi:acyl-CoA synthetase (AMP-forming)/AMP-acid ligase II